MMKRFYCYFMIILSMLAVFQQANAQTIYEKWPRFEEWVGIKPTERIFRGKGLFEHPVFQEGIKQLNLEMLWNDIWHPNYVFIHPVQQSGEWILVMGQHPDVQDRDLVIFINLTRRQIEGVCLAGTKFYNANPFSTPLSKTQVTYYLGDKRQIDQSFSGENCGGDNLQQVIRQWQEVLKLVRK
ncbi:MAG TPA: hypothetical protein PK803_05030 [Alphaproteobacteria bacterium]|nr:hypothetical protein [Alphaproteobacteria bacterium]